MKPTRRISISACALAALLSLAGRARASSLSFGCVGTTPDRKQRIVFNSERLVLYSAQLVADKLLSLTDDAIASYTADGNVIEGDQVWKSGDETLRLVFKSSKQSKSASAPLLPNECPPGRGPRWQTHTTSKKVYEVVLPGAKQSVLLRLDCYEYVVSTCS